MLRDLLLRDLAVHRRVLFGSAVSLALILATWVLATWTDPLEVDGTLPILGIGLFLVALLPLSLHKRELLGGTLGSLLALPACRRDLVRLRYLEGLLAGLLYLVVFLVVFGLRYPGSARTLGHALRSPAVTWVPVLVLAYPMPFALRGPAKWMGLAFGIPFLLELAGVALASPFALGPERFQRLFQPVFDLWFRAHAAPVGACALDYGLTALLLLGSYRLSLRSFARAEA